MVQKGVASVPLHLPLNLPLLPCMCSPGCHSPFCILCLYDLAAADWSLVERTELLAVEQRDCRQILRFIPSSVFIISLSYICLHLWDHAWECCIHAWSTLCVCFCVISGVKILAVKEVEFNTNSNQDLRELDVCAKMISKTYFAILRFKVLLLGVRVNTPLPSIELSHTPLLGLLDLILLPFITALLDVTPLG